jgi:hypothetical protein
MSMSYGLLQRWRPSTRSAVVRERSGSPRRTFTLDDIERGWRVEDSQATRIGTVVSADGSAVTVSRGFLVRKLRVPLTAIVAVREGAVGLNVTVAWVEAHGWDRPGGRRPG